MKNNFERLFENLSEDDLHELEMFRHHIMRFKWLADDCHTWDDIIQALKDRISFIEELKNRGAEILDNNNDHIFYEVPGEYAVYATLRAIENSTYEFHLADGTILKAPIIDDYRIPEHRVNTKLVLLITKTGQVLDYIINIIQPNQVSQDEGVVEQP